MRLTHHVFAAHDMAPNGLQRRPGDQAPHQGYEEQEAHAVRDKTRRHQKRGSDYQKRPVHGGIHRQAPSLKVGARGIERSKTL